MDIKKFTEKWTGKGNEKQHTSRFWIDLLTALGVKDPTAHALFERPVRVKGKQKYIDVLMPSVKVLVEQKSLRIDLDRSERQSDGEYLTPYEQGKRYSDNLKISMKPRWIVTCNFVEFRIYDMDEEQPEKAPLTLRLDELEQNVAVLAFLVRDTKKKARKEEQISIDAGNIVNRLYNAFLALYGGEDPEMLKHLNILIVRLVFLMYCEDAGILEKDQFSAFVDNCSAGQLRRELLVLFETLNTPNEERSRFMEPSLSAFDYMNGGLFRDAIEIPPCSEEVRQEIIRAGRDFNWSAIDPTIFGAVFESTLNPETRRSGGMHYTSLENIHKVIDPLFLDELTDELDDILNETVTRTKRIRLENYQKNLASLVYLDPGCGSGNFLTETYLCLRRLENQVIRELIDTEKKGVAGQIMFGAPGVNPIKVSIQQFYGIEINDFAVSVAMTALWIAEAQTIRETEEIIHTRLDFLPLETYANIREGNALRMDWNEVVQAGRISYILGNPPFVGARYMSSEQKKDVSEVFPGWKNAGNLDYVSCWYKKAADLITDTDIRCALVSTNSITQGEAVANLWKPLMDGGVHIDFAHRTFRWDSEAVCKAHVHCVIVGFSKAENKRARWIFREGEPVVKAENINGYLADAPNVFVASRSKPICDVPGIGIGNKPIDDGNYLFSQEKMEEFIAKEPLSEKYFHPWYGSREFINRKPRYCLYLGDCAPEELKKMPECLKRIEAVRNFRLASKSAGTRKIADTPTRFHVTNMPEGNYIVIPEVSSERRRYVPMGFMTPDILCSNLVKLMPDADLYHFGVLTSNVHMAWLRTVCGRLKSDYRYSKDVVYNNFPWPSPSKAQQAKIDKTAQGILDARALYPDSSLAALYDPLTMPPELLKAHQENDKAVMGAYGFDWRNMDEEDCVAELMRMYQKL